MARRHPRDNTPTILVRITRAVFGSVNGVRLQRLRPQQTYDVPVAVAWYLVAVNAAVLMSTGHSQG